MSWKNKQNIRIRKYLIFLGQKANVFIHKRYVSNKRIIKCTIRINKQFSPNISMTLIRFMDPNL